MADFLLELRSEEIPARMQDRAREDLARLFAAELDKAGLKAADVTTYATPRRLVLIARDLPLATQAVSEETKGPKTSAPPQAVEGFLRKTGLIREQLTERDGVLFAVVEKPGRATADVLAEAIPAIVRAFPWPKSMRWGTASASTESLRWVRPLQGIVALFGEDVVACEVAGISSGAATLGHRFHHPGVITIGSAGDYVEKLRACHVLVDQDERRTLIRDGARELASAAGLELIEDEGLVAENAGLTEWPVPLLGRFDEGFLEVPPEVIQLTARVNQKYFVCRDVSGQLANAFICTANIDAVDGGARIIEGNRKVLAARLSDAQFFYDQDVKVPLADQAAKLDRIVFHEKLGTVADKVDRVAKLARWLVEEGIVGASTEFPGEGRGPVSDRPQLDPGLRRGTLAEMAERAARLAKADLVTGMVGEFPELQGLMGGYYAAAQGEPREVAEAIRDHYKPVGQGDDVPTAPVTVAVSLADKLDTLAMFFAVNLVPTGSRDPFALRRAAIGIIELISLNNLRLKLKEVLQLSPALAVTRATFFEDGVWDDNGNLRFSTDDLGIYHSRWDLGDGVVQLTNKPETAIPFRDVPVSLMSEMVELRVSPDKAINFFADRLKVQQREAGVRHDLIDAVFALGGEDDLVRLLARVHALQAFITTEDGANLLAGYKRAANILKKEGYSPLPPAGGAGGGDTTGDATDPGPPPTPPASGRGEGNPLSYTPEKDEAALIAALERAAPAAAEAVAREDFEGAMAALASLRAPIDAFFDTVTVNDADADKRAARLALLARVTAAVHGVADFSKIEG